MRKSVISELSIRAIVLGLILAAVMGAANVYLGLKAGMTVSASIPAAVMAMVVLRLFRRKGTILESNQVQTAASAGESLAAGIIFTIPALVLIGAWQKFDMLITTLIAFAGGIMGILFMIPMRRVFVTSKDSGLKFPEGVACAAVLEAGSKDAEKGSAKSLVYGGAVGVIAKMLISFFGVVSGTLEGATRLGQRVFYMGSDVSPALVAVGYIVGLNVSVLVFIGGALAWFVGLPLLSDGTACASGTELDYAWSLWSTDIRYIGVGCMVIGGVASIFKVRHGVLAAVKQMGRRTIASDSAGLKERDLPRGITLPLLAVAVLITGGVYYYLTQSVGVTILTTAIMIVMSFFFTAVASYIVGLVGNSNSPVSGMTITTVLFTGVLLVTLKFSGMTGMVAVLGVAAIVCCAACTSGDICNDLKTGQLVGASPFRQQIMQICGVAVACLVMAPVMQLLHNNTPGGIGGKELSAPQAQLFASLARGFFGDGNLKWSLVGTGAVLGVVILMIDGLLVVKKSPFRAHLMPIAVGMYLPLGLAVPILAGGVINWIFTRRLSSERAAMATRKGILFSSGTIAGESLTGVGIAILSECGIRKMALIDKGVMNISTIIAFVALLFCFVIFSRPKRTA